MMDIYLVGGAVRDELLGLPVKEKDWVVVDGTPDTLLAQGYKPVGNDFPVFLHPRTGEEYALARTERKHGHGHGGFLFHTAEDVTLEDDLKRRDLTINAMARAADGRLIDPYNGQNDLKERLLRHVSPAFAEDPLRVLRVARFAARYHWLGFRVARETMDLMTDIVLAGELQHLSPERVWKETSRALMERSPQTFFRILHECGALAELFPELANLDGIPQSPDHHPTVDVLTHQWRCLAQAARQNLSLTGRYALLCHDLGKASTPPDRWPRHQNYERQSETLALEMSKRLRVPREMADAAAVMARWQNRGRRVLKLRPPRVWEVLHALDVIRRPRRLRFFVDACEADYRTCQADPKAPFPQGEFLLGVAEVVRTVDVAGLRQAGLSGPALGRALESKRIRAIRLYRQEFVEKWPLP
ncbi:tRNA nucleotidyltransferase (CCA-adding enzyme) [Alloalcanivorax xenomutans]|nr:tRNA nucleotidyltransferase (CCA-adding enzyme) [Alloalcanivorax xenomutans]